MRSSPSRFAPRPNAQSPSPSSLPTSVRALLHVQREHRYLFCRSAQHRIWPRTQSPDHALRDRRSLPSLRLPTFDRTSPRSRVLAFSRLPSPVASASLAAARAEPSNLAPLSSFPPSLPVSLVSTLARGPTRASDDSVIRHDALVVVVVPARRLSPPSPIDVVALDPSARTVRMTTPASTTANRARLFPASTLASARARRGVTPRRRRRPTSPRVMSRRYARATRATTRDASDDRRPRARSFLCSYEREKNAREDARETRERSQRI